MMLQSRISRLEQKHRPGDPYEHMSIDEIAKILADLDCQIEASAGMPAAEYADMLEGQIEAGTLVDMDETLARGFIESVRTPNLEIARQLQRESSMYPRFLRSVLPEATP